jgi:hypothetical protein
VALSRAEGRGGTTFTAGAPSHVEAPA